jgi:hypothetical protein
MGMPAKDGLTKHASILASSGLNGKSVTGIEVYQHGSTIVIEVTFSGGSSFIKVRGLVVDVGGTNEFGTGTLSQ